MRARDLEELGVALEARGRCERIEPDHLDGGGQSRGEGSLVGVEQHSCLAHAGDGHQQAHHMSGQAGDVAHGDETRARGRLGVDEPRQEAGGLRRLDEPACLEHAGVIAHQ